MKRVIINIASPTGGSGGSLGAAYLYQGSTLLGTATVQSSATQFVFPDGTPGTTIPAGVSVPYTLKVDVSNVTTGPGFTVSASIPVNGASFGQASGSDFLSLGSAQGNIQTIIAAGPLFTLVGTPSITKTNVSPGGSTDVIYAYTATFNVNVQAIGGSVSLGLPTNGNGWPAFRATPIYFNVLQNGAPSSTVVPQTVSYSQPANTSLSSDGTYFTLSNNQSVTIPVTVGFTVTNPGASTYGVRILAAQWFSTPGAAQLFNFTAGNTTPLIMTSGPSYAATSQASLNAAIWDAIREYYAKQ
jgi:hypothetical protein